MVRSEQQLGGIFGAVGRLIAPADIVSGRLTALLGILWLTGGAWVLLALGLGLYDQGWRAGIAGLCAMAVVTGAALLVIRDRRLGTALDVSLTLLGSLVIALATFWAGERGAGATGVLYVYAACFAAVSLRRQAVATMAVSAAMHLVALAAAGYEAATAIWVLTWGTAVVGGLLVGAAVEWLRQVVGHLEEANEHKIRFVAIVSHELRTPLTAIIGFSETLQREWDRLGEESRRRFLAVIEHQAERQLRLVEDLLTVSTLMRGSVVARPEPVDVEGPIRGVVEALPFDVAIEVADGLVAMVDPDHLERVLDNLLVNADRYGEPPLVVRATPCDEGVRIDVVDHGTGISGGLGGGLLEPFVQGDSGDGRRSAGVGLGLTLCRDLLALNRGSLEYEETPGGGATIRVILPTPRGDLPELT